MIRYLLAAGHLAALALLLGLLLMPQRGEAAWTVAFRDDGRPQWQQLFKLVGPTCTSRTVIPGSTPRECMTPAGSGHKADHQSRSGIGVAGKISFIVMS